MLQVYNGELDKMSGSTTEYNQMYGPDLGSQQQQQQYSGSTQGIKSPTIMVKEIPT